MFKLNIIYNIMYVIQRREMSFHLSKYFKLISFEFMKHLFHFALVMLFIIYQQQQYTNNNTNNTHSHYLRILNAMKSVTHSNSLSHSNVSLFNNVHTNLYSGMWTDLSPSTSTLSTNSGKIYFRLARTTQLSSLSSSNYKILIRLIHGLYIDNWTLLTSIEIPNAVHFINEGEIEGKFSTFIEDGHDLNKPYNSIKCESNITLTFTNISEHFNNKYQTVNGVLNTCNNISISFTADGEDEYINYTEITMYSIISSFVGLVSLVNSLWLIRKLEGSSTNGNAISLITVGMNTIWNAYGCLCHFFLCVSYKVYICQFGFPALIYFVSFSVVDIRLLYTIWALKYNHIYTEAIILRRKLMQFYLNFYVIMFVSFFYVLKFYFDKPYTLCLICLTWLPQIMYNMYYQNKKSLPLVYYITVILGKMFPVVYFRGTKTNFFELSTDYWFICLCCGILVIESVWLYSQTLLGARWFLPLKYRKGRFEFYKTLQQLTTELNNADDIDCLICLLPLIPKEDDNECISIDVNINGSSNSNSKNNVNGVNVNSMQTQGENVELVYRESGSIHNNNLDKQSNEYVIDHNINKGWKCNMKIKWNECVEMFVDFHEKSMNIYNKPYMVTPCHHAFHSECLESWFKMKKECPSCRNEIPLQMFN